MASKTCSSSLALFLTLNLLFFALVSACGSCPGPNPRPRPRPPRPSPNPSGGSSPGSGSSPGGSSPSGGGSPSGGNTPSGGGSPSGGNTPSGGGGTNPGASCPRDALKLGVCANVLNGLLNLTLGQPPVTPCCSLLSGLVDLEAAVCLCTALRANILGINLNLPISLSLLLNVCSRNVPRNFQCP